MSYAWNAALQQAIYARLAAAVEVPVLEALPQGGGPAVYVLIGPEEVRDASDATARGADVRMRLSVMARAASFAEAKTVAGAVSEAMEAGAWVLSLGRVVGVWFWRAEAKREPAGGRRIDLIFRLRLEDAAPLTS